MKHDTYHPMYLSPQTNYIWEKQWGQQTNNFFVAGRLILLWEIMRLSEILRWYALVLFCFSIHNLKFQIFLKPLVQPPSMAHNGTNFSDEIQNWCKSDHALTKPLTKGSLQNIG